MRESKNFFVYGCDETWSRAISHGTPGVLPDGWGPGVFPSLLKTARTPSPARFTEYWMRSRHVAGSFVRGMIRDEFAAEDVLQAVAIAAATNFEQYDEARPFAG